MRFPAGQGTRSIGVLLLAALTLWSGGMWTPFVVCLCDGAGHLEVESAAVPCCSAEPVEASGAAGPCCVEASDCDGCMTRPLTISFRPPERPEPPEALPVSFGSVLPIDVASPSAGFLVVDPILAPSPAPPTASLRC